MTDEILASPSTSDKRFTTNGFYDELNPPPIERWDSLYTRKAAPQKPDFNAFWDGDEQPAPTPALIKKVLPLNGLVMLGGKSGAGKSYVAVHLAICLAASIPFFGHKPRIQSNVLYIAAEGGETIVPRLAAAKRALGLSDRLTIRVIRRAAFPADDAEFLSYLGHVQAEVAAMRKQTGIANTVIITDTVSAAFSMQDENAASEVVGLCKRARQIGEACKALHVVVHHFGKDEDRLFRGSSAWRDNIDHAFSIFTGRANKTAETSVRNINIEKSRIGREGKLSGFTLEDMVMGIDEDGDEWTEGYVRPVDYVDIQSTNEAVDGKKPGPDHAFRTAFVEALHKGVIRAIERGSGGRTCVKMARMSDVREEFFKLYVDGDGGSRSSCRQAWGRRVRAINEKGLGYSTERSRDGGEWIWRADMNRTSQPMVAENATEDREA